MAIQVVQSDLLVLRISCIQLISHSHHDTISTRSIYGEGLTGSQAFHEPSFDYVLIFVPPSAWHTSYSRLPDPLWREAASMIAYLV